jgi:hypothetical protein
MIFPKVFPEELILVGRPEKYISPVPIEITELTMACAPKSNLLLFALVIPPLIINVPAPERAIPPVLVRRPVRVVFPALVSIFPPPPLKDMLLEIVMFPPPGAIRSLILAAAVRLPVPRPVAEVTWRVPVVRVVPPE